MEKKISHKDTLNLPRTNFPMKADLGRLEPKMLEKWGKEDIYSKIKEKTKTCKKYILHDGPPYANGHIHQGHALNKILKDLIIKSKLMEGYDAPYVPGWDCHGLPIEHQVLKELGPKKQGMTKIEIRKRCREYANKFVDIQREEFKRLGVFGDWGHPYLTMTPDYEAQVVREFGKIVATGSVYKGKKPVLWCPSDETALAEAEVEYQDHTSPSVYVMFRVKFDPLDRLKPSEFPNLSFIIWTTTPWTLIANEAVCVHPEFDYQAVKVKQDGDIEKTWIIAKELVEKCMKEFGIQDYSIKTTYKGTDLEGIICRSPFLEYGSNKDWPSKVILGRHVTLEQGTGCVHTAPGHGQEDYEVGIEHELPIYAPVDSRGRFTDEIDGEVINLKGINVFKANDWIIDQLSEIGTLVKEGSIAHSYPHCWRCKNPVIFRATEQWFISMEENKLREQAINVIENDVAWIPKWGKDRILGMMQNRPDWCVSRQRAWGVPIVAFVCLDCKEPLYSANIANHVADQMEREGGSDIWFIKSANELLPEGIVCPKCKGSRFAKEEDILDVWFESGVSHAAVLRNKKRWPELDWPADLYLEGSDQHRGWFHSALLAALQTDQSPPYKAVLTHGFVVDGNGKKMSKSAGNVVAPQEVIDKFGAEILRLWVAAADYRDDIRLSEEILGHLAEAYRKIRNTCRFLLANLYDFDPYRDQVSDEGLTEIDRWALHSLQILIEKVRKGYKDFEFHQVFHSLNNFCSVEMSSFYLDILKDRLYTSRKDSIDRRSSQTAFYRILISLVKLMSPLLSFTAEELWGYLPKKDEGENIFLSRFPDPEEKYKNPDLEVRWKRLMDARDSVLLLLEIARRDRLIGSSLEASVHIFANEEWFGLLKNYENILRFVFIVSEVSVSPLSGATPETGLTNLWAGGRIDVDKAPGSKCDRCWNYSSMVGSDSSYPNYCERCVSAVS